VTPASTKSVILTSGPIASHTRGGKADAEATAAEDDDDGEELGAPALAGRLEEELGAPPGAPPLAALAGRLEEELGAPPLAGGSVELEVGAAALPARGEELEDVVELEGMTLASAGSCTDVELEAAGLPGATGDELELGRRVLATGQRMLVGALTSWGSIAHRLRNRHCHDGHCGHRWIL
jgi:hypothetical protein